MGLKWSDIGLDPGTLKVNRQLQRMHRDGEKSGSAYLRQKQRADERTRTADLLITSVLVTICNWSNYSYYPLPSIEADLLVIIGDRGTRP